MIAPIKTFGLEISSWFLQGIRDDLRPLIFVLTLSRMLSRATSKLEKKE